MWSGLAKSTAASRATPMCPRQSGRLLVTSISIAVSAPTVRSRSTRASAGTARLTYSASQFVEMIMAFVPSQVNRTTDGSMNSLAN
jgi:hypothetical protein